MLQEGVNTALYSKLEQDLGPAFVSTPGWAEDVERRARQTQETLESNLNHNKSKLNKESIRTNYNELGEFFYRRGDLNQAMKYFARTRDYCTTNRHVGEMCLRVIEVAVDLDNFAQVSNYVTKAEHIVDSLEADAKAKLTAAAGLACLKNKQFKQAALKFLAVTPALGDSFSAVLVVEDVAVYGALCSLATFDREEVASRNSIPHLEWEALVSIVI